MPFSWQNVKARLLAETHGAPPSFCEDITWVKSTHTPLAEA